MSTQQSMKTASKMREKKCICAQISVFNFFSSLSSLNWLSQWNTQVIVLSLNTFFLWWAVQFYLYYESYAVCNLMLLLGLSFNCKPNYVRLVWMTVMSVNLHHSPQIFERVLVFFSFYGANNSFWNKIVVCICNICAL